ncbi:hypothetical protein AGLY_007250 [Aphis glycines]|uniref:Uncharacterized protein n=1 Tax=Aphis glycines TaxID=307491 RepID=A0A6G0TPL3_APHGL|nr:hypothetical protein AGLY_007250 [Aphis glycines]
MSIHYGSLVTTLWTIRCCSVKSVKFSIVMVDTFKNCSSYFSQIVMIFVETLGRLNPTPIFCKFDQYNDSSGHNSLCQPKIPKIGAGFFSINYCIEVSKNIKQVEYKDDKMFKIYVQHYLSSLEISTTPIHWAPGLPPLGLYYLDYHPTMSFVILIKIYEIQNKEMWCFLSYHIIFNVILDTNVAKCLVWRRYAPFIPYFIFITTPPKMNRYNTT